MTRAELIKRLEGATEGSRELDLLIADAFGIPYGEYVAGGHYITDDNCRWSRSFDAALTLVPEGWHLYELRHVFEHEWRAGVARKFTESPIPWGVAETAALALCIACLRALDSQSASEDAA